MVTVLAAVLAAAAQPQAAVPTPATPSVESPAFMALTKGDFRRAEDQLLLVPANERQDAAWLINYGQVMLHKGRFDDAIRLFEQAAAMNDGDLILANGQQTSSAAAARAALAKARQQIASR